MVEVRQTPAFAEWLGALRDLRAIARIDARIGRLRQGNFGDVKSVGGGVSELRVHHGPGYRVYFAMQGESVVILLCGGDKDRQPQDIERAKTLAAQLKGEA